MLPSHGLPPCQECPWRRTSEQVRRCHPVVTALSHEVVIIEVLMDPYGTEHAWCICLLSYPNPLRRLCRTWRCLALELRLWPHISLPLSIPTKRSKDWPLGANLQCCSDAMIKLNHGSWTWRVLLADLWLTLARQVDQQIHISKLEVVLRLQDAGMLWCHVSCECWEGSRTSKQIRCWKKSNRHRQGKLNQSQMNIIMMYIMYFMIIVYYCI